MDTVMVEPLEDAFTEAMACALVHANQCNQTVLAEDLVSFGNCYYIAEPPIPSINLVEKTNIGDGCILVFEIDVNELSVPVTEFLTTSEMDDIMFNEVMKNPTLNPKMLEIELAGKFFISSYRNV